ncbi:hypothetical protein N7492_002203 [Penicillium capsulatum]|uniref:Alcohol acetyltransferase n=1 Tax=Penicillium capsulatum TaxID=69766 RepID=A0A9W9IH46_9EURO|nr:hypothetical protein N7492_002203 [Penicillium capsulatum]KAJ6123190.1 hypothetical protein N7512_005655 [Penicillium capsulatum]
MASPTFLRFASPNERRTISREDVGFYNAVVIAAVYEVVNESLDVTSPQSFFSPLKQCILAHPFLSVVVQNKDTEKPSYGSVSSVNLEDHISIDRDQEIDRDGERTTFEKALPPILDRPWPADLPPWRIVVLPLASCPESSAKRCLIAFAFSHTLGDGMVGITFHRTFLEAWKNASDAVKKVSRWVVPTKRVLPEPFDTPERLPISWSFLLAPLLAVYLPKRLALWMGLRAAVSTVDDGTWTGPPIFSETKATQNSRVRLLEIEAPLVEKALQTSRRHGAKLTSTLHQLIVRALSKAIPSPEVTNFVSGTAVDMRGSIGVPPYTWGLYVSGHYDVHPRVDLQERTVVSDEMWTKAGAMTRGLAECSARLQDQAIGLLRYVPSIRDWTLGKVGHARDCSYELSNLLAFDGTGSPECRISKMVFSQPGNVPSAPLVFNLISVKGASLTCAISWQTGALGMPVEKENSLVDVIELSLQTDLEALE